MKTNNPMLDPGARERATQKMRGRTFLARGGNSKTTKPQELLADLLHLPMEHAIKTSPVKGKFASLPPCYKVDLASPAHMLAIEVDGQSHKSRKWRFLDARKTAVLNALGWTVLRFWNSEVMTETERVVKVIQSSMT
jgi:hypothetical protein